MNTSDKNVAENSTPAPEAETPVLAPVVPEKEALNKVETKDVVPDALDTAPDTDPVAESSAGQKPGLKDAASPDDTQDDQEVKDEPDQEDAKSEPPATSAGSDPQSEFLYTLTADQHREAAKYCAGAAKAWDTEHSEKDGTLWVGKVDLWVLARALLAVADQQLTQSTTDRHAEIEVWALLNDGWLKRAYQVARADHEFMYKSYRVYIQKGSFDKYNDVGRTEERTQLNQASAWTLVKAFRAQFLAAVNVVMPRNTRDTPLTAYAAEEKPNDSKQAAHRKPNRDTAKRIPEECSWNGRSDSHLMQLLYDLMDSHNGALVTKADLSEYYKYAGWLRRQERKHNGRDASGFQKVKSGSRDSNSSRGSNRSRGNRAGGNRSGGNRCKGKGSDGQRKTRYTGKPKSDKPVQTGTKSSGRVKLGNA